jgi:hypothetical protein
MSEGTVNVIEYLSAIAVVEACRSGFEYRVESSSRSEAVYIKIRRGASWYGLRLASHEPYYRCSADYEQFLVPPTVVHVAELANLEARLIQAVRAGGCVVADPIEVDEALFAAWRSLRDGATIETPPGVHWRWDEASLRWELAEITGRRASAEDRVAYAHMAPSDAPPPDTSAACRVGDSPPTQCTRQLEP